MAMCKYHAGMLRHSITIEERGGTPDAGGGMAVSWSTYATAQANVKPLSGSEALRAHHLEGRVTHRIVLRYRSGVTTDMRVLYDGRYFNIRAAINVEERGRWLEIHAEEGVAS